jgi:hypothetical protein
MSAIQIHTGEGGEDAANFAVELGRALNKYLDGTFAKRSGSVTVVFDGDLDRL